MVPQVVHFKKEPFDVYIGRPSAWGNPFSSKAGIALYRVTTKAESLNKHRSWVLNQPIFINKVKEELKGKILGCWCNSYYACHGLILWQIANSVDCRIKLNEALPTLFD